MMMMMVLQGGGKRKMAGELITNVFDIPSLLNLNFNIIPIFQY